MHETMEGMETQPLPLMLQPQRRPPHHSMYPQSSQQNLDTCHGFDIDLALGTTNFPQYDSMTQLSIDHLMAASPFSLLPTANNHILDGSTSYKDAS
jgi:hypothetical protein